MRKIFVAGIGTEIGKTVVSAVLCEALEADYFKPIQCGSLNETDSMMVQSWVSNHKSVVHQESVRLKGFKSPHAAAEEEGVEIHVAQIKIPDTDNTIVIEAAGGLMVPLNNEELVIDLIGSLGAETVLVSRNYLGSINHTLLSVEILNSRGYQITGIIFNGDSVPSTEKVILAHTGLNCLGRIALEPEINREVISRYAEQFRSI